MENIDFLFEVSEENSEETQQIQQQMDYGILIEAIQSYKYLYDLSHKSYKDSKKKVEAWKQISQILNLSVNDCMKAWKNLRDRFVKEKNKLASGAGAPESNWVYFDQMRFYLKYTRPRETRTSTRKLKKIPPSSPSSSTSMRSSIKMETISSPELYDPAHSDEEPQAGPSLGATSQVPREDQQGRETQISSSATPSTASVQRKQKITPSEENKNISDILKIANSLVQRIDEKMTFSRNANSAFSQYVFEELETLPENQAKRKRQKMLSMLFEDSD